MKMNARHQFPVRPAPAEPYDDGLEDKGVLHYKYRGTDHSFFWCCSRKIHGGLARVQGSSEPRHPCQLHDPHPYHENSYCRQEEGNDLGNDAQAIPTHHAHHHICGAEDDASEEKVENKG